MKNLAIKKLHPTSLLPTRSTEGSAGYDLYAFLEKPVTILPHQIVSIPTGIAIALPDKNTVALLYGRSGLGAKHGVAPANAVGVIDSDYRGELIVALLNQTKTPYVVSPGDRIAQLVLTPVLTPPLLEVTVLPDTLRGTNGFGSSGK